jgi:hypothetical protein
MLQEHALVNPPKPGDLEERLAKATANSERALDELYYFRET